MADHYYSGAPESTSETRFIAVSARGVKLQLRTDNGVFSKNGLDEGTRRLIEVVMLRDTDSVLDLGAGYGPVSAILGTVYPKSKWTLVDINERAAALATENTAFMSNRRNVTIFDGTPLEWVHQFDAVILNPPIRAGKSVVYRLFQDAERGLRPGGSLWVVIQRKHGAPSAQAELSKHFSQVSVVYKKSGYYVFAAKKVDDN